MAAHCGRLRVFAASAAPAHPAFINPGGFSNGSRTVTIMTALLLGCIADDFTGATDLANNLVRAGMRVVQTIGVPEGAPEGDAADAVVVALKSRTIAPDQAVAQSVAALRWLRAQG